MNINEEIQKATDAFIAEKLPGIIQEKVGKMVDSVLGDVFDRWSNTSKSIKEKIEKKLDINLQEFDLVDYNHLVGKAINDRLVGIVNEQAIDPILKLTEETVGFLQKKECKLSEINDMILEEAMEENESDYEGEISFHIEYDTKLKWYEISMDLEKGKSPVECSLQFLISGNNKQMFSFRVKDYISRKQIPTPAMMTRISNLEHKIFRLYSAQVKIEVDIRDGDTYWSRES